MTRFFLAIALLSGHLTFAQENYVELVWSDEFDTDGAPNPGNWGYDIGHGDNGWGNREVQYYTNNSQNIRVEGGRLIIHALKDQSNQWTSARLKSQGKRSFTYGRFLWRAKLPPGSGTWPALWMLGENATTIGWPASGEIDVMEHVGKWPGQVLSALHTTSSHGDTQNKGTTQISNIHSEFHIYELQWTPDKLVFLVDGTPHYTYNPTVKNAATWPFNAPFFIIMNIAMGGGLGSDPQYETGGLRNGIDPVLTQAKMEVDYVRVYQAFTGLKLQGPSVVQKNQGGIQFRTNHLDQATYEWSVPAGATITAGQGTPEVSVQWGETEGDVKVIVKLDGETLEERLAVTHVVKPQGSIFPLRSSEFGIQWADVDPVNEYDISEEPDAVRIDYRVTTPSSTPSVAGTLVRALDLSDHPVVLLRAKSFNRSRTLRMRLDLVDESGRATNKSPVFNLNPLIDDGVYYDYRFDFDGTNQWLNESGNVNASRITKINVYVDFGVFGSAGSDSLWIDNIFVATRDHPVAMNRPSHLSGKREGESVSLNWRDNSNGESGFHLYQATEIEGPYERVLEISANTTSTTIVIPDEELDEYFFRIAAVDGDGETDFSNIFRVGQTITSIGEGARGVQVYPNPVHHGVVYVEVKSHDDVVRVLDLSGREQIVVSSRTNPVRIDLSQFPPGVYLIAVSGMPHTVRKLLLL